MHTKPCITIVYIAIDYRMLTYFLIVYFSTAFEYLEWGSLYSFAMRLISFCILCIQ